MHGHLGWIPYLVARFPTSSSHLFSQMNEEPIDISRSLAPGIAVWPGDQTFGVRWSARIADGSSVNVGAVTLSTHTGTHADAPLHYDAGGAAIDALPLSSFVGPAWVVEVPRVDFILPEHLRGVDLERFPRVLFKTRSSAVPDDVWSADFAALHPDLVAWLGARGVVLVGTDAPSVDPADSTALPAHHALARHRIVNLENLSLGHVSAGGYRLVALPLKLSGMDASPVRAVLLPLRASAPPAAG